MWDVCSVLSLNALIAPKKFNLGKTISRKSDNDNHSNQLNPNHDEYWNSRGEEDRPHDWEDQTAQTNDDEN